VQLVEQANIAAKPTTPRRLSNLSPTSSKIPQSQVQAEIVQKVAEELHSKKMTDQSNAKAKRSQRGRSKLSQEKEASNDNSRRKPPASSRGFGLFRRNSRRSMKSPKSQQARQEAQYQEAPREMTQEAQYQEAPRESSSAARQTQQQPAANAAEYSEEFEDYLEDSHTTEQPVAGPTHNFAMAPRSILKSTSFTVAPPTVDTGAASTTHTAQTETDLCDEDDVFCGLLSTLVGNEDKTVDESRYSEAPTEQSQGFFAEFCSESPKNKSQAAETTADVPRTISPTKKTKKKAVAKEVARTQDSVSETRSVTEEESESEYLNQLDQNEPILVTCLRDNHCPGAALISTIGCQQNYEILDEALQAENPKAAAPAITGGGSVVEVASLALDDHSKRRKRTKPKKLSSSRDVFFDELPIRTIEIPSSVILDSDSATASFSSLGGRRKTDLFVDTQLEQDMQEIQDELDGSDGKKKKTIFGRMKRASQHKQQQRRNSRNEY
jgi:hypothetical protein